STANLFIVWFFICIATTVLKVMPVANIAHGVGALTGGLLGMAISSTGARRNALFASLAAATGIFLFLASAGRSYVNVSQDWSHELWGRGVEALERNENEKAVELFERAVKSDKNEEAL